MNKRDKSNTDFVCWFRQSSPYIHAHRGKVFVLSFGGEVLTDDAEHEVLAEPQRAAAVPCFDDVKAAASGLLSAEVLISPLAREGEREPRLVFAVGEDSVEAVGSFWILPALDGQTE